MFPTTYHFGNVAWNQINTGLITLSYPGSSPVTISSITLTDPAGVFSFTSIPLPYDLGGGESIDVPVAFKATSLQQYSGLLTINWRGGDPITVKLDGIGVLADAPNAQVQSVINYINDSITNGTLFPEGSGNSASNRVKTLNNMLESASNLLEATDTIVKGCQQLADLLLKVDGNPLPPDFVSGSATPTVASIIEAMQAQYQCQ